MIRINLSKEQTDYIEYAHWEWFKKEKLLNLIIKIYSKTQEDNNEIKEDLTDKDKTKKLSDKKVFEYMFFDGKEFEDWSGKEERESFKKWFSRVKDDKEKFKKFEEIILGKPEKLKEHIEKYNDLDYEFSDTFKNYMENQYKEFRKGNEANGWDAAKLTQSVNITVCPYCNRAYIDSYKNEEKNKFNGQLDHFYPKSKYPFLALSLYNLIPTCGRCNTQKNDEALDMANPYSKNNKFQDEVAFSVKLYEEEENGYDLDVLLGKSDNFKIELKDIDGTGKNQKSIDSLNKVLDMETLYNLHKGYVQDMIKKSIIYNESRIDELSNEFSELFTSRDEVENLVLGRDKEEIQNRVLGKLTEDIYSNLLKRK